MTYKEFFVEKASGTYSETLEAYGLAKLLEQIIGFGAEIRIENIGTCYRVTPKKEITQEKIDSLSYAQIIPFIKDKEVTPIPTSGQGKYFDFPAQKVERDKIKQQKEDIRKDKSLSIEQKKEKTKAISDYQTSEFAKSLDAEYDVYKEIVGNPYSAFTTVYDNFDKNQKEYNVLVTEILKFYANQEKKKRSIKLNCQQLYSPNQGKGLNRPKADGLNMGNESGFWISETMKTLGALNTMSCQTIKVGGSSYDMKVYVPDFNDITLSKSAALIKEFKKYLKSVLPIKLDILNVLNFTITFIRLTEGYQGKVKNTIGGFHTVYQKSLGQFVKSVANIAFIETPEFVECTNKIDGKQWIEILNEQIKIVQSINENQGDATQGLLAYRNFLSSSNLNSFFKFSNWYSVYLMQALDNKKYYIKPFKVEILNLFYEMMDKNNSLKIGDITKNAGFLAVTKAIRNSTVILQSLPKNNRKFSIRYGLAQELFNHSKTPIDLARFIGDFIGKYNSETSQYQERLLKEGRQDIIRANVRQDDLNEFYSLLDQYPSRLLGSLLSSIGFAKYGKDNSKLEQLKNLAEDLGYELVKIENDNQNETDTNSDDSEEL